MAYTTINKSGDYFNTKLYTGDQTSSSHSITGVGFAPDFVWIKDRQDTSQHTLTDKVRGATKTIASDSTDAESTSTEHLQSFDSDGFTVGQNNRVNQQGVNNVSWNWKANGAGSANTDGSINSTVSANTTSGFSIVSYTGNAVAGATIGHGLGVVPKMIITKKLNGAPNWAVYHAGLGNASKYLELNLTSAEQTDSAVWDGANPTASLFYVGSDNKTNGSGGNYIAYCFAEKTGYSKFGTYRGNVTTDNTFIYTGFAPAFWMMKNIDDPTNWMMFDSKRRAFNETQGYPINANESNAEDGGATGYNYDFLSNGIKLRGSNNNFSKDNDYIYMAFAAAPLVGSNGVTAKAR